MLEYLVLAHCWFASYAQITITFLTDMQLSKE